MGSTSDFHEMPEMMAALGVFARLTFVETSFEWICQFTDLQF